MSERILLKNESAILKFHSDGIVHHEFLKRMVGKDFREVLDKGLAELIKTKATKWLSDDRKNTVMDPSDEAWANTDWFPRAAKSTWKFWAIVNPEKVVGQLQMARQAKTIELGGVKVAFFAQPEQAMEWLRSVDASLKKTG